MVGHFDCKHSCLIGKNVHLASILPSRWHDGTESLGIETTSCLCLLSTNLLSTTLGQINILELPVLFGFTEWDWTPVLGHVGCEDEGDSDHSIDHGHDASPAVVVKSFERLHPN